MSDEELLPADAYDGVPISRLAALLDAPRIVACERVGSTLDVAHALGADGAPAGTLVLAEAQTAGRGRSGRRWMSAAGSGIWLTLLERPIDPAALDVLSLRVGLRAARVLDRWTDAPVRVKWPNDLYLSGRKLAGILIEARWREGRIDWVAIGIGINVAPPPDVPAAAGLRRETSRVEVLGELLPALRAAAAARGPLSRHELAAFAERDLARGRRCSAPAEGIVGGITGEGALVVRGADGESLHRAGSLVLLEER